MASPTPAWTTPDDPRAPKEERGILQPARAKGGEKHGQAAPPGGGRRQRTPTAPRGSGSPAPGAARLRRLGTRGRGERAEPAAPGGRRSLLTRRAGGGRGARTTCCLPRAEHPRHRRASSLPAAVPGSRSHPGPASGQRAASGRRRRVSRRQGCAAGRGAPLLPALSGGGWGGARWPRAGSPCSHAEEQGSLWQARHAPPPPLGGPALLFLLSPPLAPGDPRPAERGRGAAGGELARPRLPRGPLPRLPPARAHLPPALPSWRLLQMGRAWRHTDPGVGDKVAGFLGAPEAPRKTRHVPWLPLGIEV